MIAALAAAAALAGCGQRGPLYLPDSPPKKRSALELTPPAAPAPASAEPLAAQAEPLAPRSAPASSASVPSAPG
ncbi:MAG: lipoprotein [Burkholderiaceae bacterium]